MVPLAPQGIKPDHVFRSFSLRHFVRNDFGSPLFVVNKLANFQYGKVEIINKEDLHVNVLGKESVLKVVIVRCSKNC